MRKYYPGITVFKLLGSIAVLMGHIKLPAMYLALPGYIAGLQQMLAVVVPCFYIVAGFLACQGWSYAGSSRQYITRYLAWVVGVYGFFCGYYILTTAIPSLIASYEAHASASSQLHRLFEVFFVSGPFPAMWFMPPLIFGILAAYFFESRGRLTAALVLAGVGYLLAQGMGGTLRSGLEVLFSDLPLYHLKHTRLLEKITSGYLGMGFPFVLAGVVIAKNEVWFMQLRKQTLLLFVAATAVTEVLLLNTIISGQHVYALVFTTLPGSVLLFYGVLHIKAKRVKAHHALINRFSAIIYFSHIPLIFLNTKVLGWPRDISAAQAFTCALMTLGEVICLTKLLTLYLDRNKALIANEVVPVPAAVPSTVAQY